MKRALPVSARRARRPSRVVGISSDWNAIVDQWSNFNSFQQARTVARLPQGERYDWTETYFSKDYAGRGMPTQDIGCQASVCFRFNLLFARGTA